MRSTLSPRAIAALAVFGLLTTSLAAFAQAPAGPSIDDVINLKRVGSPAISPNGQHVAYTIRETNWDENAYETEIWIADVATGQSRQVTNSRKSSTQPSFSPDGAWLGFVSDRDGKRQVYRIALRGGEAEKLTSADEGVNNFAWSPNAREIAYTTLDPQSAEMKEREKRWGDVKIEDQDQRYTHLHVFDVAARTSKQLTKGNFVVGSFEWSPDGRQIAYDHRTTSDPADSATADISIVATDSGRSTVAVAQDGPDNNPRWSPDGTRLAFVSAMSKPFFFYQNNVIATVTIGSTKPQSLSDAFDEDPNLIAWTKAGIQFAASQRTWSYLFTVHPETKQVIRHAPRDNWIGSGFSLTPDGTQVAFIASGPTEFPDIYAAPVATMTAKKLSDAGAQLAAWPKHAREVIRWKSQDGAEIEGVLHKPADFQAGRRYPLLVIIHGGPTGVSRPSPYGSGTAYPLDAFLAKGALILEPNYRGSAGYGEKFRSLNVRNLGIGDAWDVISGIDALVQQGIVDRERVGSMGWSQGGYISAFLTTKHSDRFKAISVGAGISDWMTYYVNTDIHPFTRQYLKANPWDDPKIYADTSPMTYVKQAKTPTLIQHGDQDARVPIPNAFQLYQGLRDQNVPVQLSIFKGFGHGLNKPKANRAAMQQNLDWFTRYIWDQGAGTRDQAASKPPVDPKATRKADLVELVKLDPTIKLDIRYAGTNNFLGKKVYPEARAFLQRPAAMALLEAHKLVGKSGYGLLIHDGYRPWAITKLFWDMTSGSQREFVADPKTGSKHNRGAAVDLTLYDLATGAVVQMPGDYDEMTPRSYPNFTGGTAEQRARRDLLRHAMESNGFTVEPNEWWHFNYKDWTEYPILDIAFSEIK